MWAILKQQIWQWHGVSIAAPCVAGIVVALRLIGAMQLLELVTLDEFFRLRPAEPADPRIVIVTIDESDIKTLRHWPMSDAVLARLLLLLKQQQPKVIGLDLYRDLPVEPGHRELVKVFTSTPNLIGIEKVVKSAGSEAVAAPPVLKRLGQVSAVDFVLDIDGKLRRSILNLRTGDDRPILSLGAALAFKYLATQGITPQVVDRSKRQLRLGRATFAPLQAQDGGYIGADVGGYQILSNPRRLRHGFRTISLTQVLQGRMPPDLVRDRIVSIGVKAESVRDSFYTAFSTSPDTAIAGVEVHAQLTSELLSAALDGRPLLRTWAEPLEWLWILLWAGIGAAIGWKSPSPQWTTIGVLLGGMLLLGGAYLLFLVGWWLIAIPPLFALVGAAIASSGYLLWQNLKLSHQQLEDYAQTLEQNIAARTLELAREKELLQTIVDRIPVMVLLYDANGRLQFVNREVKRLVGWSAADFANNNFMIECFPNPEQRQLVIAHKMAATGKWLDVEIKTKDNRYLDTSWANIRLSNGMSIGIGQDISDRKRAEEAIVLEERNRMAREIHDTLAQAFTGILIHVRTASNKLSTNPPDAVQVYLETVGDLARTGLAEARRSVEALRRPYLLENNNLHSALNRLATQMGSSSNTQIVCHAIDTPYPLPAEVENNLLRIGQEALTNALKYAQASEIRIELIYESTRCLLQIEDNGRGFAIDSHPSSNGFGLRGMAERADRIGAQLQIQSTPGGGTSVIVSVSREKSS
ncbi:CHASE2 domain-containing protein [Chroococcidiopsis sp. FACHB-1243]|uniref:CHASE2 domain-containing protein n=1 Tax=Chroococcidiopsis sp. [FACHB-1243] TaxID=2692781 RepID=UPI001781D917|nr:CHASE2 domain-containing protein [Chroococcidiopsis sp. [FACHB-1243]]MBD2308749.1 CHASE2 domain-containing protein [Chroococcidiopsis sp. [FACHB-1243]]